MPCAAVETILDTRSYEANLISTPPTLDDAENGFLRVFSRKGAEDWATQAPNWPEWIDLYQRDKPFASFVNDVLSLYSEEGETPPESSVVDWVLECSVLAKKLLAQNWIPPRISSDDNGGLRLNWKEGEKELRVVVPANATARYLYWQVGAEFGGVQNFGSATLYTWLRWLNEHRHR